MLSQSRFVLEIVNQASLDACVPREISVPTELALGHLRCRVTDMPPQPNSPSGRCLETRLPDGPEEQAGWCTCLHGWVLTSHPGASTEMERVTPASRNRPTPSSRESGFPPIIPNQDELTDESRSTWSLHSISEATFQVVVFHLCFRFHLYYTSDVAAQSQTGVKLNRVFFPRLALQVRSLDCRFAR